jgi:hypothetical protein
MGYKCLIFGINVKDLRGDEAIDWGVEWIQKTYGSYLSNGDYKNAFHIHNSGHPLPASGKPETYNPRYIEEGLKWMEYFQSKL